jgi:hypothetical protein
MRFKPTARLDPRQVVDLRSPLLRNVPRSWGLKSVEFPDPKPQTTYPQGEAAYWAAYVRWRQIEAAVNRRRRMAQR